MKHGEATSTWHAKWQGWGKENSHQCWGEEQFWGQFLPSLIPEAKQIDGQECKAGSLLKNTMKSLMFTKCCPGPRRKKKNSEKGARKLSSFFEVILFKVCGFLPMLWADDEPSTSIREIPRRKNFMDLRISIGGLSLLI